MQTQNLNRLTDTELLNALEDERWTDRLENVRDIFWRIQGRCLTVREAIKELIQNKDT